MPVTTGNQPELVAERARRVRNGALGSVVVLFLAALLLDVVFDISADETMGDTAMKVVVGVALSVACLAQVVRLVASFLRELNQPGDRRLPALGAWARVVCRGAATAATACWLLAAAISFPAIPQESVRASGLITVLAGSSVFVALLALASGLVWLTSEVISGYREPNRRRP